MTIRSILFSLYLTCYIHIALILFDVCSATAQRIFTSRKVIERVSRYGLLEFLMRNLMLEIDAVSV